MKEAFLCSVLLTAAGISPAYDWSTNPGDGSPENPYQISEPNHLMAIGSDPNLLDKHFVLTTDIVFDPNNNPAHVFDKALIAPDTSASSGFQGTAFTGIFDGDGYTVLNLKIDSPTSDYVGLFGSIDSGTAKNLTVRNTDIQADDYVGILAGSNYAGSIGHCTTTGSIGGTLCVGGFIGSNTNSAISHCSADCQITIPKTARLVGGFVGYHEQFNNTIQDCTAAGTLNTSSDCDSIGGFAGANDGSIDNCSADCTITTGGRCFNIGGFAGANFEGMLTDSFSEGLITCMTNSYHIGGLIGAGPGGGPNRGVERCYSDCDILLPSTGCQYVGGLIGRTYGGTCRDSFTTRSYTFNANTCGGLIGLHSGILEHCYTTGDVTGRNFAGGLIGKSTNGRISHCHTDGTVEGLNIVGGLIGWNENAEIVGCSSIGQVIGTSGEFFGGLIGNNEGTVKRCFASGSVSGYILAGGLIGNCWEGTIVDSYASGTVSGGNRLGGLVGTSYGTTITNCYSSGIVSSSDNLNFGGLLGQDNGSTVVNSSYFLESAGPDNGYGTPLDDPNMMIQANFVGWDFVGENTNGENEIWRMCVDGVDYPRLSWEFAANGDFACGDGVDLVDLESLCYEWLTAADITPTIFNYACDANGDEQIDLGDFGVLSENWE